MKKWTIRILLLIVTGILIAGCEISNKGKELNMSNNNSIKTITVNTTVRPTGQYPESFVITYKNALNIANITADSFHMTGHANYWQSKSPRPFECSFESAKISGNTLTLIPKDFPEKYFYVQDFSVVCSDNDLLNFTDREVTKTITPVADDFETFSNENHINFDYHLFTPEKTENMPIVVVFHGFGDTENLLTYRTAVEWAEPKSQTDYPCYVLAPVIPDEYYFNESNRDAIFADLKNILDDMITSGKVDKSQVYVMGNSFGGMSTIEFSEKYPDFVTRALALCPALTYSKSAEAKLPQMKNVPIWFCHASGDNTIPVTASREAVSTLEKNSAKEVHFTEFTDDIMNSCGADGSPDATNSYHHVELAVMGDTNIKDWLFGVHLR